MGFYSARSRMSRGRGRWPVWSGIAVATLLILSYNTIFKNGPLTSQFAQEITDSILRDSLLLESHVCGNVPDAELDAIRDSKKLAIHAFTSNGQPLTNDANMLTAPENSKPLCIIVSVPQQRAEEYTDIPVYPKGPDDIHLYMNSSSGVAIDFLPLDPLDDAKTKALLRQYYHACSDVGKNKQSAGWRASLYACYKQFYDEQAYKRTTVLYGVGVTIIHGGHYTMHAEIEYSHYTWAHQWIDVYAEHRTRYPTGLEIPLFLDRGSREGELREILEFHNIKQPVTESNKHPRQIFAVSSHALEEGWRGRPYCNDSVNASKGRWLHREYFPAYPENAYDEWSYAWDGDFCRTDWFTAQDIIDCIETKSTYVFGDSNLRRLIKSLASGNSYCWNPNDFCQDGDEGEWPTLSFNKAGKLSTKLIADPMMAENWGWLEYAFGRNGSIWLGFTRTITYQWLDWARRLYDFEDLPTDEYHVIDFSDSPLDGNHTVFDPDYDLKPGAVARHDPTIARPDLLVVGASYWDYSYVPRFSDYESTLPHYVHAILEAYPDIPIVIKLTQGECCRPWRQDYRRFSGMRLRMLNDLFMEGFKGAINRGQVSVVDPRLFTGRPQVPVDYDPGRAGHARFSRVRLESQMLLNSVCVRKDGPGTGTKPTLKTFYA